MGTLSSTTSTVAAATDSSILLHLVRALRVAVIEIASSLSNRTAHATDNGIHSSPLYSLLPVDRTVLNTCWSILRLVEAWNIPGIDACAVGARNSGCTRLH